MPYKYRVLKEIIGDADYISELETKLKREHKEFRYFPKIKFKGAYECFSNVNAYFPRELLPIE